MKNSYHWAQRNITARIFVIVWNPQHPKEIQEARITKPSILVIGSLVQKANTIVALNYFCPILIFATIFYQEQCALFYIENDAEIFLVHYTWKVAQKGFKMALMKNKLAMINSCEIMLVNFYIGAFY